MCTAFQKSIRDGKEAQFKEAVEALIENSVGTVAESAPLDVYSSKPMITFGDPDTKFQLPISLLAFCGFRDRLEFAKHLIEKGASKSLIHDTVMHHGMEKKVFIMLCKL